MVIWKWALVSGECERLNIWIWICWEWNWERKRKKNIMELSTFKKKVHLCNSVWGIILSCTHSNKKNVRRERCLASCGICKLVKEKYVRLNHICLSFYSKTSTLNEWKIFCCALRWNVCCPDKRIDQVNYILLKSLSLFSLCCPNNRMIIIICVACLEMKH